mmetsp:Transcript_41482/g.77192  ORF Transcript_41482/g.77192 Transcript_41482/m.77192 type:complete len:243 (-) Transcript_41482:415-1143(-)
MGGGRGAFVRDGSGGKWAAADSSTPSQDPSCCSSHARALVTTSTHWAWPGHEASAARARLEAQTRGWIPAGGCKDAKSTAKAAEKASSSSQAPSKPCSRTRACKNSGDTSVSTTTGRSSPVASLLHSVPSTSASRIISSISSSESFSPRFVITCRKSAAEMKPSPRVSNMRKASTISSSQSKSRIFLACMDKNSGKSIVPLPSQSTSFIMSCNSASVGLCPKLRRTFWSCLVAIVPDVSAAR